MNFGKFDKKAKAKIENNELRSVSIKVNIEPPSSHEEHVLLMCGIKYNGTTQYKIKAPMATIENLAELYCVTRILG